MDRALGALPSAAPLTSADRSFRWSRRRRGPPPSFIYCFEYLNDSGEVEWLCVDI